ncbi:cystathionine beta-lyase [Magnetovibrio sp.]|uniref:cystathionine beta-lyase n=1 Tax=Magnetovibrio sp. TaxID=2024836 RepID=UPI002F956C2F
MTISPKNKHGDTRLTTSGRNPEANFGIVNPPVYHASTVTFPTVAALRDAEKHRFDRVYYGRYGTPTTFAFEEAVADLEGAAHCVAVPSGMAAIAVSLAATLHAGEHVLVSDSVYFPTISYCKGFLKKFGVEVSYFPPMASAAELKSLMRDNTKIVFTEAPGSITFEVQDIPMIADIAHAGGAKVVMDNTWSAGYHFKPFEHGVDISVQAATKYIVGHSDAMLGTLTVNDRSLYEHIKITQVGLGYSTSPDDCYLGLRGLRSLATRLPRHESTGLKLAEWLAACPEVETVLHPALPSCPGHDIFKRDFTGSSGLFGVVLKDGPTEQDLARMLDGMELFAMGYSWGGFESLIIPSDPRTMRTTYDWPYNQPVLRIHAGLEDPDDLLADLEAGLKRLST